MNRGLFLDRDGTLIVDKHHLGDPAGVEVLPGVPEALRRARALGFRLFLFTNQSAIGRGLHTWGDAERVNARMVELIGLGAPLFEAVCMAPEVPGEPSRYRKPSPRFIEEMVTRFALDRSTSWMVGDKSIDALAGLAARINAALVATGKPIDLAELPPEARRAVGVFPDLGRFVEHLA